MLRKLGSFALVAAAACGGGSSSSIAFSDLAHQYAVAECTKVLVCCAGVSGAPTEASCEASVSAQLGPVVAALMADTNITYNGDAAAACAAELKAGSCEELSQIPRNSVCNTVFIGKLANGAHCTQQSDCQSGLCENVVYNGNTVTTPGTCSAQSPVGADCNAPQGTSLGSLCASGSFEDFSSASACTCTAVHANGTACDDGSQCSSYFCDSSSHTCAAFPQLSTLSAAACQQVFSNL